MFTWVLKYRGELILLHIQAVASHFSFLSSLTWGVIQNIFLCETSAETVDLICPLQSIVHGFSGAIFRLCCLFKFEMKEKLKICMFCQWSLIWGPVITLHTSRLHSNSFYASLRTSGVTDWIMCSNSLFKVIFLTPWNRIW